MTYHSFRGRLVYLDIFTPCCDSHLGSNTSSVSERASRDEFFVILLNSLKSEAAPKISCLLLRIDFIMRLEACFLTLTFIPLFLRKKNIQEIT